MERGKFLSAHGVKDSDYVKPGGANLVLWDNPESPESQWYLLGAAFVDEGGHRMQRHVLVNVATKRTLVVSRCEKYRAGGPIVQSKYPFSQESIFQLRHDPHYNDEGAFIIESIYNPTQYIFKGWEQGNGSKILTDGRTSEWGNHWYIKQVGGPTGPMFPLGGERSR